MAENKKKGKKTAGNIIRNIVLVLAIGVFCFSGYHVIDIVLEYKQGTDEYEELEQYVDIGNEGGTQENSETNDNTQELIARG